MVQFQSIRSAPATSPKEEEAKQIIDNLAVSYQDIGKRWPKERHYGRIVNAALIATLGGLGYFILFSSEVFKSPVLYAVTGWTGVSLVTLSVFTRKYNAVALKPEEKIFITAYELTTELRQYPIPIAISDAAGDLDYITAELESNWTLGFPLAKEALSGITDFMKNLRFRLLPALAKGKTEDVKLAVWTLAKLCPLLINDHPKLSEIDEINSEISKLDEWKQVEKVKFHVDEKLDRESFDNKMGWNRRRMCLSRDCGHSPRQFPRTSSRGIQHRDREHNCSICWILDLA